MLHVLTRVRLVVTLAALLAGVVLGQQANWIETVREGSAENVRAALAAGADLEAHDERPTPPLMLSDSHGRVAARSLM
jgi:hypothetical protein